MYPKVGPPAFGNPLGSVHRPSATIQVWKKVGVAAQPPLVYRLHAIKSPAAVRLGKSARPQLRQDGLKIRRRESHQPRDQVLCHVAAGGNVRGTAAHLLSDD